MSPEQAMSSDKLDEGADIYSFGVMIYELVVGRVPFEADTPLSIVESHIFAPVPPPRSIRPDLSMDVEKVLLKALSKDRHDRHEKVTNLVDAFKGAWIAERWLPNSEATLRPSPITATLNAENGKSFLLISEKIVIGRNSAAKGIRNDIDVSELDTSKIISRHHAMIRRQKDVFLIYDLSSRNGTYLNGKRVFPQEPLKLSSGDIVELGKNGVKLTFLK
jgi:serine/threonine protein kinase